MKYLILYLLLEPVKRILSALLYPVAYVLRGYARTNDILWPEYLYTPYFLPVWLLLDDSAFMEFAPDEYADKAKYYPAFINRLNVDFFYAYWWAAIRNSFVNWNNYSAYLTGDCTRIIKRYGSDRNFYEVREFDCRKERPYIEFWTFGKRNQLGWIKRGRFEIDILKSMPA